MTEHTPTQTTATAPGKVILAGEHAVVYGRPAIAVPVWERLARATLTPRPRGAGCVILAPDTQQRWTLAEDEDATGDNPSSDNPSDDAPVVVARATLARFGLPTNPDWQIELTSTIPVASGLGSGAALLAALVRAILTHAGITPDPAVVSELVYLGEQRYHGTPSGIDNSVVSYGMPIWFVKGDAPRRLPPRSRCTWWLPTAASPAPRVRRWPVCGRDMPRTRRAMKPSLMRSARWSTRRGAPSSRGIARLWARCLTATTRC